MPQSYIDLYRRRHPLISIRGYTVGTPSRPHESLETDKLWSSDRRNAKSPFFLVFPGIHRWMIDLWVIITERFNDVEREEVYIR